MMTRTHLAIVAFAILDLIGYVENKLVFVTIALIATLIPDIDTEFSSLGKKRIFRSLQWFVKHRGLIHSFTFLILITILFTLFIPFLAFGFFVGYSLHLFADSFTIDGIQPFFPVKKKIAGKIRVGGIVEVSVFVFFVLADAFLLVMKIVAYF